jgi:hypothetical protein
MCERHALAEKQSCLPLAESLLNIVDGFYGSRLMSHRPVPPGSQSQSSGLSLCPLLRTNLR